MLLYTKCMSQCLVGLVFYRHLDFANLQICSASIISLRNCWPLKVASCKNGSTPPSCSKLLVGTGMPTHYWSNWIQRIHLLPCAAVWIGCCLMSLWSWTGANSELQEVWIKLAHSFFITAHFQNQFLSIVCRTFGGWLEVCWLFL